MLNKKELLKKISEEAETSFQSFQNEGKIIVWDYNNGRKNYIIETEEDFLNRIKNRFNEIIEDIEEEDEEEEELQEIDFDKILNEEFDFEYIGWEEYYNPIKRLENEEYKYTYLICFIDHTNTHRDYLETVVHSNTKINSESEMSEMLKQQGEEVPGEFGIAWANYYFKNLKDYDIEDLYLLLENDEYKSIEIDK